MIAAANTVANAVFTEMNFEETSKIAFSVVNLLCKTWWWPGLGAAAGAGLGAGVAGASSLKAP